MKKIILALGVVASVLVLASCASKGTMDQSATDTSSTQTSTSAHHDFKGESSLK
jgi:outer membrane murein-binding lipoprotein Lpp